MGTKREAIYQAVLNKIDEETDAIFGVSDAIHAKPELALEEYFASDLLATTIERYGYTVERGAGGVATAFKARKRGSGGGPAVALLAEYDALPGLGHACGHNLIAGSTLAAAVGLTAVIDKLPGEVMFIGTPAEEAQGGKVMMIEGGVFDDVDAALSTHHSGDETMIAVEPPEGTCLAVSPIKFEYFGKTAHAAYDPHEGVNALNAVIQLFTGIDALRQHVTPDVRIHGIITDGGLAPNIVPEYAAASFYFRAGTKETLERVVNQGIKVAEGAALITGARLNVDRSVATFDDVRPNYTLGRILQQNFPIVGLVEHPKPGDRPRQSGPAPYSTDLGNISRRVPTAAIQFAISETPIAGHSADVVACSISELGKTNAIKAGKSLALATVDLLADPSLMAAAKAEFDQPS